MFDAVQWEKERIAKSKQRQIDKAAHTQKCLKILEGLEPQLEILFTKQNYNNITWSQIRKITGHDVSNYLKRFMNTRGFDIETVRSSDLRCIRIFPMNAAKKQAADEMYQEANELVFSKLEEDIDNAFGKAGVGISVDIANLVTSLMETFSPVTISRMAQDISEKQNDPS